MSIALFPSSSSTLCSRKVILSLLVTTDNLDIGWQWNSYKDKTNKTFAFYLCFHPST
jgi:hypothetical protein